MRWDKTRLIQKNPVEVKVQALWSAPLLQDLASPIRKAWNEFSSSSTSHKTNSGET